MNEAETIERSARPPSRWGLAAMGVGALAFGVFMGLGPMSFAAHERAVYALPTFAGIGAMQLWFGFVLLRELWRPSRDRFMAVTRDESSIRIRRVDAPMSAGITTMFVGSGAWMFVGFALAWISDWQVRWYAWAGWPCISVLSLFAYTMMDRRIRAGRCDYVVDRSAGVLRIPPRFIRGHGRAATLKLDEVTAIVFRGVFVQARTTHGMTPLWRGGKTTGDEFAAVKLFADELGVPLLEPVGQSPREMFPTVRRAVHFARRRPLAVYLALLLLSHAVQPFIPREWYRLPGPAMQRVEVASARNGRVAMAFMEWGGGDRAPVILLHGCPGQGADFSRFGPRLGRRAIAVDQLGFGESSPWVRDYSIEANAEAVLGLMDGLGIARAHVVGWSNGGGTALHMADRAPERVASITLLASIGTQEVEGSGSYVFEHAKYAALGAIAAGAEVVPHFGLLGPTHFRHASVRFFWDSDQRPLAGIMARLSTPTMILHGWRDFLVPARAAERSHELIGPSTLVMLEASHFIPFLQAEEAAAVLVPFFARHDEPGVAGLRQSALTPRPVGAVGASGAWAARLVERVPWWVMLVVIAVAVWRRPRVAAAGAGVLVGFMLVDFGVAAAGVLAGLGIATCLAWTRGARGDSRVIGSGLHARTREDWSRLIRSRPVLSGLGAGFTPGGREAHATAAGALGLWRAWPGIIAGWVVWTVVFFVVPVAVAGAVAAPLGEAWGVAGLALGLVAAVVLPRVLGPALTRLGRAWLRITFHRATRREYWPTLVQYLGLAPVYIRGAIRHGGATFTCCNPGIPGGGGIVGESKMAILDALGGSPLVLPAVLIGAGPDAGGRADEALRAIATRPELGGFPVILKPDAGQRGFAVKVARGEGDVRAYFSQVRSAVLVQRYHAGPRECGIVWVRGGAAGRTGRIYSVTRKEFPVAVGDGKRTLEELILRHPRFHCQAAVFFERLAAERSRVLGEGERLRLAHSGNHCQGTMFTDGADLITPELERVIDGLAAGFASPLDMCRFDIRYESDEGLRRGEGLAVVELNGTTGESTNIYEPGKSIAWAYGVLAEQWRLLYELGAVRRKAGVKPMGLLRVIMEVRKHEREKTGPGVAD